MKHIQLLLRPQPHAKPEFLADLQVVDPSPIVSRFWQSILATTAAQRQCSSSSSIIVLEDYTREKTLSNSNSDNNCIELTVTSVDGRQKLTGFCKYLQDRKKSAYGRFGTHSVWIVNYETCKYDASTQRMTCSVCMDYTKVAGLDFLASRPVVAAAVSSSAVSSSSASKPVIQRKAGLLGKLVGAQQRTNQHVAIATQRPSNSSSSRQATATNGSNATVTNGVHVANTTAAKATGRDIGDSIDSIDDSATTAASAATTATTKTAQTVLADFRQAMADKMLDFDVADEEEVLRIPLSLQTYHTGLSLQDKTKVTMEILKYMVYEAAEEVNEEWVAHREATGFLDETVIAVYKEGAAPPEVLEELNKGELPDEVLGQQRAIQEERMRLASQVQLKHKSALESQAHRQVEASDDVAVSALNVNKRDRRTIEDYERGKKSRRGV